MQLIRASSPAVPEEKSTSRSDLTRVANCMQSFECKIMQPIAAILAHFNSMF